MHRILSFSLLLICLVTSLRAQPALPPSAHGGDWSRVLDFFHPENNTLRKTPEFDFARENPNMRALAPLSRNCVTVEVEATLRTQHAESEEPKDAFENWLSVAVAESRQKTRSLRTRGPLVLTVPVVVHIVASQPVENVSDEQVYSQLEALNEDFRRTNPDRELTPREFQRLAVDTEIQFCLATIDPNGEPTDGINRVSVSGSPFSENEIDQVIKPNTIWDPNRYMNIWVCNLSGGILGFAQFPSSSGLTGIPNAPGTANSDGVVVNYMAFGTTGTATPPFDKGRTLTHEVGHWLGLRHIWGDGPCDEDDYCLDTPPSNQAHFECPPASTLACDGTRAMVQNFMDYSNDDCMNLFTANQKERMRVVLENSPRRKGLLQSQVCSIGVIAAEPDFSANVQAGCNPLSVSFSPELEEGEEGISYQWVFPGGRPSSSDDARPEVKYKNPGRYNVSLRVFGPGGNRSIEKAGFIQVYETGVSLPLSLDFESDTLPNGFYLANPDRDLTWEQNPEIGAYGKSRGSWKIANFDNNYLNSEDILFSPVINLSKGIETTLSFDIAYTYYDERYSDTLGIFISTECDGVFHNIYYKGGAELAQASPFNKDYQPQPGEWRTEKIDLSAFEAYSQVQIALVNFSGYGNNLYLDNLKLASLPKPAPVASFLLSSRSICPGDTIQFNDNSQLGPEKWVWSFPGGFPASDTTPNPRVVYPNAGTYDVLLTVSNRFGTSTVTRTAQVEVKPQPDLKLLVSKAEICPGEEVTLRASQWLPDLRWTVAPGDSVPADTLTVVRPKADFIYRIEGKGAFLCTARAQANVRVDLGRKLQILPPAATICEGVGLQLNATGADQYHWLPGPGLAETFSGTVEVKPTETTTYTLVGTTRTGCEVNKEVTVTVNHQVESVRINPEKEVFCPGEQVVIKAKGATSYRWSPSTSLNTSEGAEVVAAPEGDITYQLTATTAEGCISRSSVKLRMGTAPLVQVGASETEICEGETILLHAMGANNYHWFPEQDLVQVSGAEVQARPQLSTQFNVIGENELGCKDTASVVVNVVQPAPLTISPENPTICRGRSVLLTASGGRSYTWTPSVGLNATFRHQVVASPLQDQTYRVDALDERGCQSFAETTVKVNQGMMPTAGFTAEDIQICAGLPVQYHHKSENAAEFLWEFPGGQPATSSDPNPLVTYPEQGVYDVVLTVTGCDGTTDRREAIAFMVVTAPLELSLNVGENITVCKGSPMLLEASGAESYSWQPDIRLSSTEGARVMAQPDIATTYTVTGRNLDGCEAQAKVRLNVVGGGNPLKLEPLAPTLCQGESVVLQASGAYTYRWSPKSGLDAFDKAAVTAKPGKTTAYQVMATDLNGCVYLDTVVVKVNPRPKLVLSHQNPGMCEGEQMDLAVGGGGVVSWSPAFGLNTTNGPKVTAFPTETTTYKIQSTNQWGCKADTQLTLTVRTPAPLLVQAQDKAICAGTGTLLTAAAGHSSYTWSPAKGLDRATGQMVTAAPEVTTTYTVSSDQEGCVQTASITVEVLHPAPLSVDPTVARICRGESIPLSVSGGREYSWDASEGLRTHVGSTVTVRPQQTSSYTVRSRDSLGCETAGSVTIHVAEVDFLEVSSSASTVCEGEEVSLQASGAQTYEWLPAPDLRPGQFARTYAQPLENRTYSVIGVDSVGCSDTARISITVDRLIPNIRLSANQIDLADSSGAVRFYDLTESATNWEWSFGEGGVSEERNPLHIYAAPGSYPIQLKVSNGICEAMVRQEITIVNSSSLAELRDEGQLQVAVAAGIVNLSLESPRPMFLRMRVLNQAGEQVVEGALRLKEGPYQRKLDLSSFGPGEYLLQLSDGQEVYSETAILTAGK